MAYAMSGEECVSRLAQMRTRRTNFDNQWQQVKNIIWPDGADFTTHRSPGEKTNVEILDASATIDLEQAAALHESFTTPRTQRWHRLVPTNPELRKSARVKEWFEKATDVLFQFRNSPRSRFSNQTHEDWKSILAYGNGNLMVQELPTGGTAYRHTTVAASWIDTDADGIVDTVFYEYKLSAKAAVGRWKDQAPPSAHACLGTNPFTEHTYLHAVYPNPDYDPTSRRPEHMQFRAAEISVVDRRVLEEGGYHELPYMWSRYTVNPAETYGRGPGMLMLPDLLTLQEMERVFLRSGQKVADPPLLVADDGVLGRGNKRVRLIPGGMTMGGLSPAGVPLVQPLQTGARLDVTMEMAERRRKLIRRAFSIDVLEILIEDRTPMTATEFLGRAREKATLVAPIIGRYQSERLGPMITRELGIAVRQNKLPQMPEELIEAEGEYEIEYESDATRMQKAAEIEAYPRTFESLMPLFQADPGLLSIFKSYESVVRVFEAYGGSSQVIESEQGWKKIQAAQNQAAMEAQAMEQAPGAAKALRDVSAAGKDMAA